MSEQQRAPKIPKLSTQSNTVTMGQSCEKKQQKKDEEERAARGDASANNNARPADTSIQHANDRADDAGGEIAPGHTDGDPGPQDQWREQRRENVRDEPEIAPGGGDGGQGQQGCSGDAGKQQGAGDEGNN